jgi:putative transposase
MYDYRRMTAEQQKAVVEARRARGFPLHKPPHLALGEGWYLISAATYEHRPHFSAPAELTALGQRLLETIRQTRSRSAGWVVLPNHYHVLACVADLPRLGKALGSLHGRSSRYANRRDGKPGRRVWYKYSDRKVRSHRHFWTCLHYVIANPVKHGFARAPTHWPWSCVHELIAERGSTWVDDLQRDYPLRDFGRGWDD